jgi:hypothetical protein
MNAELGAFVEVSEGVIAGIATSVIGVLLGGKLQDSLDFHSAEMLPPILVESRYVRH